jgi:thymidylate synthase
MEATVIGHDPHLKKEVQKIRFEPADLPSQQFFNSEDVIVGNPSSNIAVAFIYTWKDDAPPARIRRIFQRISNAAFLTGYWKTTNGARYVFANLLANPNVNTLVVCVFGAHDNGHLLVDALVNFWQHGINERGIIVGSIAPNPRFEQVPEAALARARHQMDLIVLRDLPDEKLLERIVQMLYQEPLHATLPPPGALFYSTIGKQLLYDDGARFVQPMHIDLARSATTVTYVEKQSSMPLGLAIKADNLQDALERLVAFVFERGDHLRDQRGVVTVEVRSISVMVTDALAIVPRGFSEDYLRTYADEFMQGRGKMQDDFAYTYHERIFKRWGNQVTKAIEVLRKNPSTRRCLISLWDPATDLEHPNPPCLNFIWLVIRGDHLELHPVYRSHHLATITKSGKLMEGEGAFVPNLYALATLQKYIAEQLGITRGPLVLSDFSGHLYMTEVA